MVVFCNKYSILRNKFYEKIEHIIPNFKQLPPLQAISDLMTSSDHYINIQLTKYISSCFDLRNILLSNQTNVLERFSFECCKTKTKVITLANHKQYSEPVKTRSNYM